MSKITPWVFVFSLGILIAAYVQELRLDSLQAEYDQFAATVKVQGEAAKLIADVQATKDKHAKETSDRDYQTTIANLRDDVKRMRNARSRSDFLPATTASSGSSRLACFDRIELEQALRRLDDGVSGLVEEGDANTIALNVAREWASNKK